MVFLCRVVNAAISALHLLSVPEGAMRRLDTQLIKYSRVVLGGTTVITKSGRKVASSNRAIMTAMHLVPVKLELAIRRL
eukprot:4100366-Lingulodinium_polyedra.AAC.1